MAFTPFKQFTTTDREKTLIQQNAALSFASIAASTIAFGQLISLTISSAIAAGSDFTIQHNLGRVPLGIIPCLCSLPATFLTSPTANATPKASAILRASVQLPVGQVVSFWVF